MKAIILQAFGSVDNMKMQDIPIPIIKDNEVLVKIKAISINPVDVKTRSAAIPVDYLKSYDPVILGWDISGEIIEIGTDVENFKIGDEIFGMVNFPGHGKAYAEYVVAPASQLAIKPKNISYEEAAGATLACLTAWQALTKNGYVAKAGDKVLIHAASGGVGHYAVQIAKHLGAYVIGTSSAANKDFVLSLGADRHIDYRKDQFEQVVSNIDFVLETITENNNFIRSLEVLKPAGTIVNLNSGLTDEDEKRGKEKGLNVRPFMIVESDGEDMKKIAELLEKGIVKSHISHTFRFDQMAQAHLLIESGRTIGKIVVTL